MSAQREFAIVEFDFEAKFADELNSKSGDVIQILYKIDEYWLYAKLLSSTDNQSGMIPSTYLNIIDTPDSLNSIIKCNKSAKSFIATADFDPIESGDLKLNKGDFLISLQDVDQNWLSGYKLNEPDKLGIFPRTHAFQLATSVNEIVDNSSSYVNSFSTSTESTVIEQSEVVTVNESPESCSYKLKQAKVIYEFDAAKYSSQQADYKYMSLSVGEYVLLTKKIDENWIEGEKATGESGIFPLNCIELIKSECGSTSVGPVLNRTQRRFTLATIPSSDDLSIEPEESHRFDRPPQHVPNSYSDDIASIWSFNDSNVAHGDFNNSISFGEYPSLNQQISEISVFEPEATESRTIESKPVTLVLSKYCQVNYDFTPENSDELACFRGEYLQVRGKLNDEWIDCVNYYNKSGLVPANFVTFLSDDDKFARNLYDTSAFKSRVESKELIDNNSLSSVDDLIQFEKQTSPFQVKSVQQNDNKYERSSSSGKLSSLKNQHQVANRIRSMSRLSPLEHVHPTSKPPVPPKPTNLDLNNWPKNGQEISTKTDQTIIPINNTEESGNKIKLIISELIDTERKYCREMTACYQAFMSESPKAQLQEFDRPQVFRNLSSVIDCSKSFLESIDAELLTNQNQVESINLAQCFINSVSTMKKVYADYTRDHNDVAAILKKYESMPTVNEYIKERLSSAGDSITSISLPTILIKPVQRIFKYPLFLDRIVKTIGTGHPLFLEYQQANKSLTEMLEYINEYKRRKEIVDKYRRRGTMDESISDKVKKLSIRTLRKKTNRIRIEISNKFGLTTMHVYDEQFDKVEASYRNSERTAYGYLTEFESYLNNFKETLDGEKNIFGDLVYMFDDDFKTFAMLDSSSNSIRSIKYQLYADKVNKTVTAPLRLLLNYLNGPNKLIQKRYDKLLDYESALTDLETKSPLSSTSGLKELEVNLEQAKKNYEAMNDQLLEELPQLAAFINQLLDRVIKIFLIHTTKFIGLIVQNLSDNVTKAFDLSLVIEEGQRVQLLSKLDTINSNITRRSMVTKSEIIQSVSTSASVQSQTQEQRERLIKKYAKEKLFLVSQVYVANQNLCQLSQKINDLVAVIKPYDMNNQPHFWYVDNGEQEGFIPSGALTPYMLDINNLSLIDFEQPPKTPKQTSSNVDLLKEMTQTSTQPQYCLALYNFKAIAANMINLVSDEIYRVVEKADKKGNVDWWLVELNGQQGYVPRNYVKLLE